jgi:Cys-tRNA(Pro)/Cys-tRNA(Cys) deacylase
MSTAPTPAVAALDAAGAVFTLHHYEHDGGPVTGVEAADRLHLDPDRVFKTLVIALGGAGGGASGHAVAVIPVALSLDLKAAARSVGAKRAEMADPAVAERLARSVVGAISPFGLPHPMATALDESAELHETIFVSGGRRGLELEVAPKVLVDLLGATVADLTR